MKTGELAKIGATNPEFAMGLHYLTFVNFADMARLLKITRHHLDLLGEKRLQNSKEHVEESPGLANVDFPEPKRKSVLYLLTLKSMVWIGSINASVNC